MKKTLAMLAIVLTLCLAASAFAASPQAISSKPPNPHANVMELMKDELFRQHFMGEFKCQQFVVGQEAFQHNTSSELFLAVGKRFTEECKIYDKLKNLRRCELWFAPETPDYRFCKNGERIENNFKEWLGSEVAVAIQDFDDARAQKGLSPRPSIDK